MNIKRAFAVPRHNTFADVVLLLLRIVVGLAFMFHGWKKIQQPFGWMGPDSWAPGVLQALAAVSEFVGGFALIIGLLTPLASLGILATMAVAAYTHAIVKGDPFVRMGPGGGSYELAAVYLGIALLFIAIGPGRFAADRALFGPR